MRLSAATPAKYRGIRLFSLFWRFASLFFAHLAYAAWADYYAAWAVHAIGAARSAYAVHAACPVRAVYAADAWWFEARLGVLRSFYWFPALSLLSVKMEIIINTL